jgi:hypothetical protein
MENYQAQDDDALFVLQLLEEADLDEWLSGTLFSYYCQFPRFLHMKHTIIFGLEEHL